MTAVSLTGPLRGVRVLDLTTLLPGPLASRMLAAAGARVTKVERPGGEDMRRFPPVKNGISVLWSMLNAGKDVVELDLKNEADRWRLDRLIADADVLIEQFRPGVMARLGLDWPTLSLRYPDLIYCSITGYGQNGPLANQAGHDLNYLAVSGLLDLGEASANGTPALPPALVADIAGGSYPAVINILLALIERRHSGRGAYLDVSMTTNLLPFAFWALAEGFCGAAWPEPGAGMTTGGSPRYRVYRTSDDRFLAVAALEEKFWQAFCEAIDLPLVMRDDSRQPAAVGEAIAARIARQTAEEWERRLAGRDVCCTVVRGLEEVVHHPQFRHLFVDAASNAPNLPLPLCRSLIEQGPQVFDPEP